ncbi:MAG: ArsR family transcriptional regulator [Actinomycetota bacterium]
MDSVSVVADAFNELGLAVLTTAPEGATHADLVVDPEGIRLPVQVRRRALVDEDEARRLLSAQRTPGVLLLVVGDRVTAGARVQLLCNHAGYLDLRGRLAARSDRLVLDADVEPQKSRAPRSQALSGAAGLEVATALLLDPNRPATVRALARALGRSPSTVSEVLAHLRADGLVDAENTVIDTGLFWRLSDRWPSRRTGLLHQPDRQDLALAGPLRLGLDDVEHSAGWALTGTAAAVAYAAPLAAKADQVLDFYVPDHTTLRRAATLLGAASSPSAARATLRVAPVPAIVTRRRPNPAQGQAAWAGWPLAHPVFVALDLAQEEGRGRQILDEWTPAGAVRVW